jgi:peptide/nickel transport system permease protein
MRSTAAILLLSIAAVLLLAGAIAPHPYAAQFREAPNASVSRHFLLGTDGLGRDRFSRLLYGGRMSLLFAPAAALLSTGLALAIGLAAGFLGRKAERLVAAGADLCLSLPWLFVLLAARALLPLNASPIESVLVTFGLLGTLGWAGPCRIVMAAVKRHLRSDFVLSARAAGCPEWRVAVVHLVPNLAPLGLAQFLVTAPAFLLAEANLGLLGLGVPEPMPSWGGMLRELENLPGAVVHPWIFAPAILLFVVVSCCHLLVSADKQTV